MEVREDLWYSKEHEWLFVDGEIVTLGISDYAQKELGDVVFVELPEIGTLVEANETIGSIESVKAVSEFYSPIDGEVIEVNKDIEEDTSLINKEPYDKGWILKLKIQTSNLNTDELMSEEAYEAFIKEN